MVGNPEQQRRVGGILRELRPPFDVLAKGRKRPVGEEVSHQVEPAEPDHHGAADPALGVRREARGGRAQHQHEAQNGPDVERDVREAQAQDRSQRGRRQVVGDRRPEDQRQGPVAFVLRRPGRLGEIAQDGVAGQPVAVRVEEVADAGQCGPDGGHDDDGQQQPRPHLDMAQPRALQQLMQAQHRQQAEADRERPLEPCAEQQQGQRQEQADQPVQHRQAALGALRVHRHLEGHGSGRQGKRCGRPSGRSADEDGAWTSGPGAGLRALMGCCCRRRGSARPAPSRPSRRSANWPGAATRSANSAR